MPDLSDADLSRLESENRERRARKDKASSGPWRVGGPQSSPTVDGDDGAIAEMLTCDGPFIAAARNDNPEDAIDALLAEVRRLRAEKTP